MNIKHAVLRTAKMSGLFATIADSHWRANRLLILGYHGVSVQDEHEWDPNLYITAEHLRRRLQLLQQLGCSVLSLTDGLARLKGGTLPPRAVVLTFDDGPADFAGRALPVLQEFGTPATLYLTTYYSRVRLPVFPPALAYIIWKGRRSDRGVTHPQTGSVLPIASNAQREQTWRSIHDFAVSNHLDATSKDELLRKIATELGVDIDEMRRAQLLHLLTPAQVHALPAGLIDVQLHTHRHCTPRDKAKFMQELADNSAEIVSMRDNSTPPRHFCYPSGNYAQAFLPWLQEAGVLSATTCVPGLASAASDPLLLPRLMDSMSISELAFEAWATGFAEFIPRRRAYRLTPDRP
jgi:peptidoglycan/xylan/chitin deacetylase (PgdA/CDA1 family)